MYLLKIVICILLSLASTNGIAIPRSRQDQQRSHLKSGDVAQDLKVQDVDLHLVARAPASHVESNINHILTKQYAKKQAKKNHTKYKPIKKLLTQKERDEIKAHFQHAKGRYDETDNKPGRMDTFRLPGRERAGELRNWDGHAVRTSLFQHHLAAVTSPNYHSIPKHFGNFPHMVKSKNPRGPKLIQVHPVPHLQVNQGTKPTTEYPVVPVGRNEGGLPRPKDYHSVGTARTLISDEFLNGKYRFEGVISHEPSKGTGDHYLTTHVKHDEIVHYGPEYDRLSTTKKSVKGTRARRV
ncbi:hypothetical protein BJ912DRAFT_1003790 [Pholiota molesta]|nr:hypothetical protein BJ912DRAFT_1003790 [Pholiota molesta]